MVIAIVMFLVVRP